MEKVLQNLFTVLLVLFLLIGSLLVIGQILGLLLQNGDIVIKSQEFLSVPAFTLSSIAGVVAYILNNIKKKKKEKEVEGLDKTHMTS